MDNDLPKDQTQPIAEPSVGQAKPVNAYYQSVPGDTAAAPTLTPTPVPSVLPVSPVTPVKPVSPAENPVVNSLLGQPSGQTPSTAGVVSQTAVGSKSNDRRQLIILGVIGLLVIVGGLIWLLWPTSASRTAVTQTPSRPASAAENRTIGVGTDNVSPSIKESEKATLFNQLTLLYPKAKVINLGSDKTLPNYQESLGVGGIVFQAYDSKSDSTLIYATLNDFPIVADHAPVLWIEGADAKRGDAGERVDRGLESSVVYFVAKFAGDVRTQYPKVFFSADSPSEPDKPGIRFAAADFSKVK